MNYRMILLDDFLICNLNLVFPSFYLESSYIKAVSEVSHRVTPAELSRTYSNRALFG